MLISLNTDSWTLNTIIELNNGSSDIHKQNGNRLYNMRTQTHIYIIHTYITCIYINIYVDVNVI